MQIRDAIARLKQTLNSIYDSRESAVITQWVTEKITGFSRSGILLHNDDTLTPQQLSGFERMSAELQNHRPVQYVLEEAWFGGMKFYVDERVLIPRPETEELVEKVKTEVKSEKSKVKSKEGERLRILDIGTGSGCIPVALKKNFPDADIWAIDVSEDALNVAQMNAKDLDVDIEFRKIDILREEERDQLPVFDIIVSNPPYVPEADQMEMSKHVVEFEPHLALFVDNEDPLIFYRGIIEFAKQHLRVNGKLFFEIHEKMAAEVQSLFHLNHFQNITVHKDLQGKERIVSASYGD